MAARSTLFALVLALPLVAAEPALAATEAQIEDAIDLGLTHVRSRQDADGKWGDTWCGAYKTGETALALLTLLKGGVEPYDPAVERGFDWLLEQPLQRVYEVSLALLAGSVNISAFTVPMPFWNVWVWPSAS